MLSVIIIIINHCEGIATTLCKNFKYIFLFVLSSPRGEDFIIIIIAKKGLIVNKRQWTSPKE